MLKNLKEEINFLIDIGKYYGYIYDGEYLGSTLCIIHQDRFEYKEKIWNFVLHMMGGDQKDSIRDLHSKLLEEGTMLGSDKEVFTRFSFGSGGDYICLKSEGYGIGLKLYKKIKRMVSESHLFVRFYREGKTICIGLGITADTIDFILAPALCPIEAQLF